MDLIKAKELEQDIMAAAYVLNSKMKAASAAGVHVAMFINETITCPMVVVQVSVPPSKITA